MSRDELVDKFDECFGFVMGTEKDRKRFFDWVMKQQHAAQHSVERTAEPLCQVCLMPLSEHVFECEVPQTRRR